MSQLFGVSHSKSSAGFLVEIPPRHGKTIIILILAQLLRQHGAEVGIIVSTPFLKQQILTSLKPGHQLQIYLPEEYISLRERPDILLMDECDDVLANHFNCLLKV